MIEGLPTSASLKDFAIIDRLNITLEILQELLMVNTVD